MDRLYYSSYTYAVFRGWHDFGGSSIADMGNYSLSPIFTALDLPASTSIEANVSSSSEIVDQVSGAKAGIPGSEAGPTATGGQTRWRRRRE